MVRIDSMNKLKITKVEFGRIYFKYDGRNYILSFWGDDFLITLYEREVDARGFVTNVNEVASVLEERTTLYDSGGPVWSKINGKAKREDDGIPYNQIDKKRFITTLADWGLIESMYVHDADYVPAGKA